MNSIGVLIFRRGFLKNGKPKNNGGHWEAQAKYWVKRIVRERSVLPSV